jgi:hypothetical protein
MQDVYRIEEWTSSEIDLRALHELRYTVLVEEMGKYHDRADHEARIFVDDEDARSWHTVALDDDGNIAAANRMTWGGAGFSPRQIDQYDLQPWIDAGLERTICVGERTMVAPAHRGGPAVHQLMLDPQAFLKDNDVHIVFGVCEPHLLSLYISLDQVPYAEHNINSEEAGYLIPLVGFMPDADVLRGVGTDAKDPDGRRSLPIPVEQALSGSSTVLNHSTAGSDVYLDSVNDALAKLADTTIGAFDGLSDAEIERCLARSNIISCDIGDRLLKAGGTGRNIFVVLEGTLEVKSDDRLVGVLTAGDAFGETAFLLDLPRTADVYAATPSPRVLSMSDGALRGLIADDPRVAATFLLNLSKMLCARLIKAN